MHQGRTRRGIDCAGLVVLVARSLGLSSYDATAYQRRTQGTKFLKHFRETLDQKPLLEALPGDVMLFRDDAYPCHSTILAQRDGIMTLVHAHATRRKVVEELLHQGDWWDRRVACFGFRGLED